MILPFGVRNKYKSPKSKHPAHPDIVSGMTPLHQAALDGNLMAVRLLVSNGADVNRQDDDTWTPLHAACAEGHTHIVRYVR